ncbi:MAG TPA: glycosyltransferase family 9 protein [Proteobacteria bacterium]|nr:glycosyltransferase family 9 protein [Pseudomonadota bacterium]
MMKVKYKIAECIYGVGNMILRSAEVLLFKRPSDSPTKILLFRTGHLGDTVCAIPALRLISEKYPDARFYLLTSEKEDGLPHPVEVLKGIISFEEHFTFVPPGTDRMKVPEGLAGRLRKEHFDLLVYLGQYPAGVGRMLRDMVFFKMAGVRSVMGFKWCKHRIFRLAQRQNGIFDDEVTRLVKLVNDQAAAPGEIRWGMPSVPIDDIAEVDPGERLIAVHTDAKFPVNLWPLSKFKRLIEELNEELHPSAIVIVGGNPGSDRSNLLQTVKGGNIIDLRGRTGFLGLAEVLRRCKLLITTDSGPAHVAAAVGIPVVGIYSARDYPNCWHPHGDRHIIIRKEIDCQICMRERCDSMACIKQITVAEVLHAVGNVMEIEDAERRI